MKKSLLPALVFFVLSTSLWANRQIKCYIEPTINKLGDKNFGKILETTFRTKVDVDSELQPVGRRDAKGNYAIQLILRKDVRYPEKLALFTTISLPDSEYLQQTHLFDPKVKDQQASALAERLSDLVIQQLKSEAMMNLKPQLASNMNQNIKNLSIGEPKETTPPTPAKQPPIKEEKLDIELLGKKAPKPVYKEQKQEAQSKTLPIAERKQKEEPVVVMDLMDRPKPAQKDPEKIVPEPEHKTHPLNPYVVAAAPQSAHLFPFPRLQNGGLAALILTPQLTELETEPGKKFSFSTWSAVTYESFNNQSGTSTYRFEGQFLQQRLSASTLLWQNINLNLETGFGTRDADIQFDALHPTAAGGTTFLPTRSLDNGLIDTTLSLSWRASYKNMSIRPIAKIKIPTGSEDDLLSTGDTDYSFGLSANIPVQEWVWGMSIHMVVAGDLGTFDPAQGDLPATSYVSFQTGIGKRLDYFGALDYAMSYHFMQNPLRELSSMPETEEDIHYVSFLLNKPLQSNWSVETQASFGLSPAAADSTLSLGFKYSN